MNYTMTAIYNDPMRTLMPLVIVLVGIYFIWRSLPWWFRTAAKMGTLFGVPTAFILTLVISMWPQLPPQWQEFIIYVMGFWFLIVGSATVAAFAKDRPIPRPKPQPIKRGKKA